MYTVYKSESNIYNEFGIYRWKCATIHWMALFIWKLYWNNLDHFPKQNMFVWNKVGTISDSMQCISFNSQLYDTLIVDQSFEIIPMHELYLLPKKNPNSFTANIFHRLHTFNVVLNLMLFFSLIKLKLRRWRQRWWKAHIKITDQNSVLKPQQTCSIQSHKIAWKETVPNVFDFGNQYIGIIIIIFFYFGCSRHFMFFYSFAKRFVWLHHIIILNTVFLSMIFFSITCVDYMINFSIFKCDFIRPIKYA